MSTTNNAQAQSVTPDLTSQSVAAMMAELTALRLANAELLAAKPKPSDRTSLGEGLTCKVSEKGAVSVYGIHSRFPITLYKSQWVRLFQVLAPLKAFIDANEAKLSVKAEVVK